MTRRHLTNRRLAVVAMLGIAAGIFLSQPLRSANIVTLTPLASLQGKNLIGIDWFPNGDQLIISDNYDGDVNHQGNFALVNRTTGAITTQLANPQGYTNEIYFASVRPNSPSTAAGWPVNHVFYAEGGGSAGAPEPQCIGEMDGAGAVVNSCRFLISGEQRIKRGGVEFDLAGIAGGDLIVVASNDNDTENSTIYRINLAGTVTTVLTYTGVDGNGAHVHMEGIATVPNDTAKYGDWAGKILTGAERYASNGGVGAVFATLPTCNNACAPTITQLNTQVEDIWVVPANSAFYGADYAEGGGGLGPQRIWRGGPEQWTPFVGKILLAREHNGQLYIVDGPSHTVTQIYDGFFGQANNTNAVQWEHTTFVPESQPRAKIEITPNATNEVGQPHTFTVTLSKDATGTGPFVPAPGEHVTVTLTDSNGATHSAPTGTCTNAGPNTDANGQCTITFTSNTAGKVTGHATSTLTVSGTSLTVATDGAAPNSGDAVKTFVDANIQITPQSDTDPINDNHVLTGHVNINAGQGAGFVNAPAGTVINFSLTNSGGATAVFVPAAPAGATCNTVGATGSCTVTISSPTAGSTQIHATTTVSVGGVSLTRSTGDSHAGDSPDASKIWDSSAVTTQIHNAAHQVVTTVAVGTTVHDRVSVTGTGATPTGNVTFDWFLNGTCTGAPAANSGPVGPLDASGNFDATGFTFPVNTAGQRAFKAHYLGDATHPAADGACEPLTVVDANISITPNGVNEVGQSHTFTAHVNVNDGSGGGFVSAPAGTPITFTIDSGPGTPNPPTSCNTVGTTGSCTTTITSAVVGTTVVSAHTTVSVGGVSLTRDTNGTGGNSGPANKVWVNANIQINPPTDTNAVDTNHVLTITVNALNGTIDAGPHTATASIASGPGSFVGPNTCTYTGGAATASCTVTITSAVTGTTVVSATSTIPVSGVPITRTTNTAVNTAAGGSGNASKVWVNANIQITPATADNPVNTNHVLTITVNAINGTITLAGTATASIVSGPGSFVGSPTCNYATGGTTQTCTVTITSAVVGTTVVSATSNITVSGQTITRTTNTAVNTAAGGSGNANKNWITVCQQNDPACNSTPCPAGTFQSNASTWQPGQDLVITYDQFPAPNDNSYGINSVGWVIKGSPKQHTFGNLTGSDHAGFQILNGANVVLDFNIDYLTATTGTPSNYKSFGPFGGDGGINKGTLLPGDITFDSSLARNLNNLGYFAGGAQTVGKATAGGTSTCAPPPANPAGTQNCALLTTDSPPTVDTISNYTLKTPNPWNGTTVYTDVIDPSTNLVTTKTITGWDFHDTYFVTIKAAKLAALGFTAANKPIAQPNLDELHNSPAKDCPAQPAGPCDLTVGARTVSGKNVNITITNNSTSPATLESLGLTWPQAPNGNLDKVKLDGSTIADVNIGGGTASFTAAQLGSAANRTIAAGDTVTLQLVFQNNASTTLANYTGTANFGAQANCTKTILP
jgi:hypothetical protein